MMSLTKTIDFPVNKKGVKALGSYLQKNKVDILLRGNERNGLDQVPDPEDRDAVLKEAADAASIVIWNIHIATETEMEKSKSKDCFCIERPGKDMETPVWHGLTEWLQTHCQGLHLLLDMTTLSGSSMFQLHRAALEAKCVCLSYAYTTPVSYPQVEEPEAVPPVITRAIKQPYGYRSFAQEHMHSRQRRHVILLGFDRHRPNKFIEHYQWRMEDVHVLLGDPAYVDGGVEQAKLSLGPVYDELIKQKQVHVINPKLLYGDSAKHGVVDGLKNVCNGINSVDLVPLGPKPTLLGAIIFWHSLSPEMQEHTRILYDFPVTRKSRTNGVKDCWIYPDVVMVNPESEHSEIARSV